MNELSQLLIFHVGIEVHTWKVTKHEMCRWMMSVRHENQHQWMKCGRNAERLWSGWCRPLLSFNVINRDLRNLRKRFTSFWISTLAPDLNKALTIFTSPSCDAHIRAVHPAYTNKHKSISISIRYPVSIYQFTLYQYRGMITCRKYS